MPYTMSGPSTLIVRLAPGPWKLRWFQRETLRMGSACSFILHWIKCSSSPSISSSHHTALSLLKQVQPENPALRKPPIWGLYAYTSHCNHKTGLCASYSLTASVSLQCNTLRNDENSLAWINTSEFFNQSQYLDPPQLMQSTPHLQRNPTWETSSKLTTIRSSRDGWGSWSLKNSSISRLGWSDSIRRGKGEEKKHKRQHS